jgi:hypothetical protein
LKKQLEEIKEKMEKQKNESKTNDQSTKISTRKIYSQQIESSLNTLSNQINKMHANQPIEDLNLVVNQRNYLFS